MTDNTLDVLALAKECGATFPMEGSVLFYRTQLEAFAARLSAGRDGGEKAKYGDLYGEAARFPLHATPQPAPVERTAFSIEVMNKFGDPEAFAERELKITPHVDVQKLPIGATFHAIPAPADGEASK